MDSDDQFTCIRANWIGARQVVNIAPAHPPKPIVYMDLKILIIGKIRQAPFKIKQIFRRMKDKFILMVDAAQIV
jgi:hypothetical protein